MCVMGLMGLMSCHGLDNCFYTSDVLAQFALL
jgi:hypothetical protein